MPSFRISKLQPPFFGFAHPNYRCELRDLCGGPGVAAWNRGVLARTARGQLLPFLRDLSPSPLRRKGDAQSGNRKHAAFARPAKSRKDVLPAILACLSLKFLYLRDAYLRAHHAGAQ